MYDDDDCLQKCSARYKECLPTDDDVILLWDDEIWIEYVRQFNFYCVMAAQIKAAAEKHTRKCKEKYFVKDFEVSARRVLREPKILWFSRRRPVCNNVDDWCKRIQEKQKDENSENLCLFLCG